MYIFIIYIRAGSQTLVKIISRYAVIYMEVRGRPCGVSTYAKY